MSHGSVSIIRCDHVSNHGYRCTAHEQINTSMHYQEQAKARSARRVMTDARPQWQIGIIGDFGGMAMQTLDFCPAHNVITYETYPGSKPHFDLASIPDVKTTKESQS